MLILGNLNIQVVISFLCVGRCMPLTIFFYYVFGLLIFGLARNKAISEMVMFPLEFTTTGGLEKVYLLYLILDLVLIVDL